MSVPNIFATQFGTIPAAQLDANFAAILSGTAPFTAQSTSRTYSGTGTTVMNDNQQTVSGNGADVGSVRGFITLTAAAVNCFPRGIESQTSVQTGATFSQAYGMEVGLHSQVNGSQSITSPTSIGLAVFSSHTGWLSTGVRNDCGLFIGGEDGWVVPILVNDTDATTTLFRVTQTGSVFAKASVLIGMADDLSGAALQVSGFGRVGAGTAITAGGNANSSIRLGPTGTALGVFCGSGVPTITATQGSLYLRSDGSSTSTRMYVSTGAGWTAVTTAT